MLGLDTKFMMIRYSQIAHTLETLLGIPSSPSGLTLSAKLNINKTLKIYCLPVKPEILTVPSGVVTVQEGDSLAVTCSLVRGSPQPVLRWGRCGGEVVEESSVLRLEEVERREAGCYQCLADNGYSQDPVTRDLTLIVQCKSNYSLFISHLSSSDPPSLEVERTEDSVESMTITCSVVARPFASVVLYRESIGGEREVLYSSSEEEGGQVTVHHHNEATVYSLHLQQLQLEDFGDYICLADSPLGHAEDRTTVAGWPRVTSVKISSDPAQSSCYRVSVQLDSQYRVHNVHLLYRDHGGGKTAEVNIPPSYDNFISHRQCNLTFSSNYSVEISSANSYGASGPVQYNFTTETQNIFNLPWSPANRSATLSPLNTIYIQNTKTLRMFSVV